MEFGVPVHVINHLLNLILCHILEYGLICEVWVDGGADIIKLVIDIVKNLIGFDHDGLLVFLLQVVHFSSSIRRLDLRSSEGEWLVLELSGQEIVVFLFYVRHFFRGQIRVFLPKLFTFTQMLLAKVLITTDLLVGLIGLIGLEHALERFL